jgi:hypothetical protein
MDGLARLVAQLQVICYRHANANECPDQEPCSLTNSLRSPLPRIRAPVQYASVIRVTSPPAVQVMGLCGTVYMRAGVTWLSLCAGSGEWY